MKYIDIIINFLKSVDEPISINDIITEIADSKKEKSKVKKIILQLEMEGEVIQLKNSHYLHISKTSYVKGELDVVRERFGFVENNNESVFIAGNYLNTGFSGDIVLAQIIKEESENEKREGKIVKVIKRKRTEVLGILHIKTNFGFVEPMEKFGKDIYIPKKYLKKRYDGKLVVVKIYDWGNKDKNPEGEIVQEIGDPNNSDTLIESVIFKNGYSNIFPKKVVDDATSLIKEVDFTDRKDLRHLPIITIDGSDAKDLDDAVYVEQLDDENYRLIVTIADVSYYVEEDSLLDKEARQRGNSVYLVDRVLPMFPVELSNDLCSLNENEDKFTFTVDMKIDKKGNVFDYTIYESVINTKYRMTYNKVNDILARKCNDYSDIEDMLFQMKNLAQLLRDKRMKRGSIDFDIPEIKVILDKNKSVKYIKSRERGDSEKIIEDFMIKANETVAEKMFWMEMPFLYRTHEKPNIDKIKFLNEITSKFGYPLKNIEQIHPGKFQKLLDKAANSNNKMLINKLMLMSMKQARYTFENTGHFGLASHYYTHFTSPIRRYSDLVIHRTLKKTLKTLPDKKQMKEIEDLIRECAPHLSKTERVAIKAEDETIRIKTTEYMLDKVGEDFKAKIIGFSRNKMFIQLSNYIESYIDMNSSEKDFEFKEKEYIMLEKNQQKVYNIGDSINVIIVRVNLFDLTVESVIDEQI